MNHNPTMYVFSSNMSEVHNWPRSGDLVEILKIDEYLPATHVAVQPHRKTKVSIVLKSNLHQI